MKNTRWNYKQIDELKFIDEEKFVHNCKSKNNDHMVILMTAKKNEIIIICGILSYEQHKLKAWHRRFQVIDGRLEKPKGCGTTSTCANNDLEP